LTLETRKVTMTCIVCPFGCQAELTVRGKQVLDVKGCNCERGMTYVVEEYSAPRRVLTTTVRVMGGVVSMLPVRTAKPIPKELVRIAVAALREVEVEAPVRIGDVIVGNLLGTGIEVISSRSVPRMGDQWDKMR
jgi:CxxC motif-containing protein